MKFSREFRGQDTTSSYIHLLAIYLIWGSTYLLAKLCLTGSEHILPIQLQFARVVLGAVLLTGIATATHGLPRGLTWRDAARAAMTGILLWVFGNGIATACAPHANSGFIVMSIGSVPLWCAFFDMVLNRTRVTVRLLVPLVVGLGGLGLVVAPVLLEKTGNGTSFLVALALQGAAITWALGTVLQRPLGKRLAPGWTAAIQTAAAAVVLGGVSLVAHIPVPTHPGHSQILAFSLLVLFGSVIAPRSYIIVLRSFSPEIATTFAYVNPVIGVLLGWAILGERPALLSLLGMAVVLGSIAGVMRGNAWR